MIFFVKNGILQFNSGCLHGSGLPRGLRRHNLYAFHLSHIKYKVFFWEEKWKIIKTDYFPKWGKGKGIYIHL